MFDSFGHTSPDVVSATSPAGGGGDSPKLEEAFAAFEESPFGAAGAKDIKVH